MASYQDLETRIISLESKLDFVMDLIRIAQQSPLVGMPPTVVSLKDMYTESKRAGLALAVKEAEVVDDSAE